MAEGQPAEQPRKPSEKPTPRDSVEKIDTAVEQATDAALASTGNVPPSELRTRLTGKPTQPLTDALREAAVRKAKERLHKNPDEPEENTSTDEQD